MRAFVWTGNGLTESFSTYKKKVFTVADTVFFIYNFKKYSEKWGIEINVNKTKLTVFGRGGNLETVHKYQYLVVLHSINVLRITCKRTYITGVEVSNMITVFIYNFFKICCL